MPDFSIKQAFEVAVRHHAAGQLPAAEKFYRQILAQHPNHADALHNLGVLSHQAGRNDVAVDFIRRALTFKPEWPEALSNLGEVLRVLGRGDEALASLRRAIQLRPGYAAAHFNLGNTLKEIGRLDEAIASYRQAIALKSDDLKALVNLGVALQDKGQLDEAIACFRRVIDVEPNAIEALNNLSVVLKEKGQFDEAIATCRRAIALKPDNHAAHANLGNALRDAGLMDEAVAAMRQAIALKPDSPGSHKNLALALLTRGDLLQGWEEYEWRWKCKEPHNFARPLWDGRPLAGATLLLHCEQGFGDTLQFIRYLPLAAERGGKLIVACQDELQKLLKTIAADSLVLPHGQPLPDFDAHCPLLSLPRAFRTTSESIPRQVPYLHADAEAAGKWRERLAGDSSALRVGLAWAGSKTHPNDRNRSMPLSAFSPLARVPGVGYYSLQKGGPAEHARKLPQALTLIDWTREFDDFADTAAFITNLDLVITVDTAVAHLAGAMGKKVWVLLAFSPDWRWLLKREDSPWYPTMRLYRQPRFGDWDSVIGQVTEALRVMAPDFRLSGGEQKN